jgi:hypothetical protein
MLYYILAYFFMVVVTMPFADFQDGDFQDGVTEVDDCRVPAWLDCIAGGLIMAYGPIMLFLWVINL